MNGPAGQLWTLLRMALTLDCRAGGPFRGRLSRAQLAFGLTLFLYFCFGGILATGAVSGLPLFLRITTNLAVAGVFIAFNVLAESQSILLAPTDIDVVYWRPIGARTLFLARLLHIGINVCVLTAVLLAAPAIEVAASVPARRALVWLGFGIAGLLHALTIASLVVVVYAALLRTVARERFHDALVWVQIGMAVLVLVVYQGLDPMLERVDPRAAAVPGWVHLAPAAWFAHLPAAWSGVSSEAQPIIFLAGLGLLVASAVPAGRRLAPSYAMDLVEALAVEGSRPVPPAASPASRWRQLGGLPRALATASLGGDPLRRAGFDFVLAHLRGDRRLRLSLIPVLAMPVVYVGFGLSASGGWDPYSNESNTTTFADRRAVVALFGAGYLFVMLAVVTVRSLASSPEWRAAWVFFAAPTRRFDAFQGGVLCGAFYGLLLPALILVLVPLCVVWRDPVHAMAHIAVPLGVALLSAAVVLVGDAAVPFAREPLRHERAFSWVAGFLVLVPLVILARAHYALRTHPSLLLLAGLVASVIAAICLRLARQRLQELPLARPFDD